MLGMDADLILFEVRLVVDLETELALSVILSIMLYLLTDRDHPTFPLTAALHLSLRLAGEQLIEGGVGICEEREAFLVPRSRLFPDEYLEVGVMQL